MGAIAERRIAGKTAWKVQGDRRESFGWIAAVTMIYKGGYIPRQVAEGMLRARVTPEDVEQFKQARGEDPPLK